MRKGISMIYTRTGECRHQNKALILVSATFLLGGLLGYWVSEKIPATFYIQPFLDMAISSTTVQHELWSVFRWPIGLLILYLFPFAGLTIPLTMLLRGFLLSYSISTFTEESIAAAVLLFGPSCIFTLPVLFLLSTDLLLRKAGEPSDLQPAVILACFLSMCLCIVFDFTVVPMLMR